MADYHFDPKYASEEQLAYARILDIGWKIGFLMMLIFFALYVFGVLPPHVPMEDLTRYWVLPADQYLQVVHAPTGWDWISLTSKGDYINYIGIAILAGITIICYLSVLFIFLKKGEKVYGTIIILEILVLILAASGILGAGGH